MLNSRIAVHAQLPALTRSIEIEYPGFCGVTATRTHPSGLFICAPALIAMFRGDLKTSTFIFYLYHYLNLHLFFSHPCACCDCSVLRRSQTFSLYLYYWFNLYLFFFICAPALLATFWGDLKTFTPEEFLWSSTAPHEPPPQHASYFSLSLTTNFPAWSSLAPKTHFWK